jgi:sporulation protein YqfD
MTGRSFLFGYSIILGHAKDAEKIINLCNKKRIPFSKIILEDDALRFSVPLVYEKRMFKIAKEASIELSVSSRRGLPALALRHRHRGGLLAGLICAIFIFAFSSGAAWDIRIDGAVKVSEREILNTLAECGLTIGTRLRNIDADVLENQILILSDDISWVSVNLSGNVANVEIRERDLPLPNEYGDALYSNVTATQNGIIVGFEDIRGEIAVEIGEAVCKDQLLISGILGGEGLPTRLTNAHGKVLAEVDEKIEIKIPKKYIKKVTKKEIKAEKSFIFFKNEIKFFSNCRNSEATCDKIEVIENLYVKDKRLPVALKTIKYIEYEESELSRTKSEMQALALRGLNQKINKDLKDAEILEKSISFIEAEDSLTLVCKIKCISNIASPRPLT